MRLTHPLIFREIRNKDVPLPIGHILLNSIEHSEMKRKNRKISETDKQITKSREENLKY